MVRAGRRSTSCRLRTIVTHWGEDPARFQGAVTPPIYEASTFAMPSFDAIQASYAGDDTQYRYTRGRNPTTEIVEAKLAALEGGEACCDAPGARGGG